MSEIDRRVLQRGIQKQKRLKKPGVVQSPVAIEEGYSADLRGLLRDLLTLYQTYLTPILRKAAPVIQKDIEVRMDGPEEELVRRMGQIKVTFGQKHTQGEIEKIIRKRLDQVSTYNTNGTRKMFNRVAGVDLFMADKAIETTMGLAVANNAGLITSLISKAQSDVENIVYSGFRVGRRWEEIAQEIEGVVDPERGTAASRARLIARDQVAKLNGQLTQERQTNLGIKRYRWRTSGDERVRESHREKEGNIYSWDDPPADTGHPGEDYQCRCIAEPVLEDIVPMD